MAEYLAPGVYVEEVSFRPPSIEGVSTSTTAFVGPTRKGPLTSAELVTSFGEFARIYGGYGDLSFAANQSTTNYMAHAVRAFFNNGGSRLFIARVFTPRANNDSGIASSATLGAANKGATFNAMGPGSGYQSTVRLARKSMAAAEKTLNAAPLGSLMSQNTTENNTTTEKFFIKAANGWVSADGKDADKPLKIPADLKDEVTLHGVLIEVTDADQNVTIYEDVGLGAEHPRYIGVVLSKTPTRRSDAIANPVSVTIGNNATAQDLNDAFFKNGTTLEVPVQDKGNDGAEPKAAIDGDANNPNAAGYEEALQLLEAIEDVSIVAAPGYSALATNRAAVQDALITHVDVNAKYRIAVLDSASGDDVASVQSARGAVDSSHAALYFPWVVVDNPLASPDNQQIPREVSVPPSGFMCGIYARTDALNGVWKAPANEVVLGTLRFEVDINQRQQEILNPLGVNCLRYFFGRGNRVWGARTISSDPMWKYVNVRRYFNYLERSIDRSTQWAVFQPNGERLWAAIRGAVSDFLFNEWRSGALLGSTPEEAYFVRCDRSTMTQNDLDNGRLICEIGVAVLKPAEFVIFRIGQKTVDARS